MRRGLRVNLQEPFDLSLSRRHRVCARLIHLDPFLISFDPSGPTRCVGDVRNSFVRERMRDFAKQLRVFGKLSYFGELPQSCEQSTRSALLEQDATVADYDEGGNAKVWNCFLAFGCRTLVGRTANACPAVFCERANI